MKEKKKTTDTTGLLFVCYGNICRSPIAEHLARRKFGGNTAIDSAGTHTWASEPAAETIAVMRSLYKLDISGHRPKSLAEVRLDSYDKIVALCTEVAEFIADKYPAAREKIVIWEIGDPYQGGRGAFERCARQIETLIDTL